MPDTDSSDCINTGDTSWVLISTVLVLGMIPALAFFEAGLLRSKNTISIINQVISGVVVLSFMWFLIGYSLVFGDDWYFIGSPKYAFFINVSSNDCSSNAPFIPHSAYALFEMMFAAITPLLITGAYAERLRFRVSILFSILWEFFIYYPLAHWIWGGGWLEQRGVLDFAGGIVIHTSAGISSIVVAIFIGRRKEFDVFHGEYPASSLPLAAIGAALLWIGWNGFNAGSALAAGSVATSAVINTQLAAVSSGVVWLTLSAFFHGVPTTAAILNGVIGGLAGVTPASGYIEAPFALILGIVLGVCSFFGVMLLKGKLKIDDALDVSSVHGLTGLIGSLYIGFASSHSINPAAPDGLFYNIHTGGKLLGYQVLAIVVTLVYAGVVTLAICFFLDKVIGMRVKETAEEEGLDYTYHKEFAYHELELETHPHYKKIHEHCTLHLQKNAEEETFIQDRE